MSGGRRDAWDWPTNRGARCRSATRWGTASCCSIRTAIGGWMVKSGNRTVLRFAVVDEDGRRSSTWRIWSGASKRPSDDTYIAPRHATQFKISLHKDGYCQHGPIDVLRRSVRPEDRQALDRWELAPDRTSNPAYFLLFLSDHLRDYPTPLQDTTVVSAAPSTLIGVFILDSAADLNLISGGTLVGILDRANGGVVAVLSMSVDDLSPVADAALATLDQPASFWEPPGYDSEEPQAAYAFLELDGVHGVIELTPDPALAARPVQRPDFVGEMRQRADLAWWPDYLDLCAILIVDPVGASPGRVSLYLDPAARCDHGLLVSEANRLAASLQPEGVTEGWDRLPDGGWATGILCRDAADRSGSQGVRIPAAGPTDTTESSSST
jgi:hypothetical protein